MMRFIRFGNGKYRFSSFSTLLYSAEWTRYPPGKQRKTFLLYIIFILYSIIASLFLKVQERAMRLGGGGGICLALAACRFLYLSNNMMILLLLL